MRIVTWSIPPPPQKGKQGEGQTDMKDPVNVYWDMHISVVCLSWCQAKEGRGQVLDRDEFSEEEFAHVQKPGQNAWQCAPSALCPNGAVENVMWTLSYILNANNVRSGRMDRDRQTHQQTNKDTHKRHRTTGPFVTKQQKHSDRPVPSPSLRHMSTNRCHSSPAGNATPCAVCRGKGSSHGWSRQHNVP